MLHFYSIRFIARSAPLFCGIVRLSGFSASSFVYSLYIAVTSLYPCFLMTFLDIIRVNITSTAILCMSCIKYFFFFPVLVNWVSYISPPNFILGRVEMSNLATKPSSFDYGLVDRLAISTKMLHKPDGPRFDSGRC